MKKLDRLQFLPGVIGLYYVVHTISYSGGSEHFRLSEILAALLIVLAFANAFVIGLAIARKKTPMKLLLASLIVLMTLFYGSISDMLFAYPAVPEFVRKYVWGKNNVFCIFLLSAAFGIIMLVVKANPLNIQGIGKGLTIFFLTLICADIAIPHRNPSTLQVLPSWTPGTIRFQGEKPDVYFIIFDSETSSKSLKYYWHYNNDAVEAKLREEGFFIATASRSNYNWTPYSIGSTLNMAYMTDNSPVPFGTPFPLALHSEVVNVCADNGYAIHNLSFFHLNEYPASRPLLQHAVMEKTLLYFLFDRITHCRFSAYERSQKDLFRATYDSLSALIDDGTPTPKFVYVHFYPPHTPAFLDEDGKDLLSGSMDFQDMQGYLKQVVYSYKVMMQLIEKIQRKPARKAVIIIQGDHGYRVLEGRQKMDEQFCIFDAVYLPNRNYALLSDSTSSVNTFRIVFDSQFGMDLPLLPDSFFSVLVNPLLR